MSFPLPPMWAADSVLDNRRLASGICALAGSVSPRHYLPHPGEERKGRGRGVLGTSPEAASDAYPSLNADTATESFTASVACGGT